MEICAPKLFAIAESICKNDEKVGVLRSADLTHRDVPLLGQALILVAHSSGLKALVEHLQVPT